MAHPVYVHVGPPRTGTSSIQVLLRANRDVLLTEQIRLPGGLERSPVGDLTESAHAQPDEPGGKGLWADCTGEILAHDGPSVLSYEMLALVDEVTVAKLMADLATREVHVVYTIRDLVAMTLSGHLGLLKRGSTQELGEYVAAATSGEPAERVWQTNAGMALQRWGAAVPPERMHVVTVPPKSAPRSVLWERFSSVIGHDPSVGQINVARVNESVGVVEAEFLRRLNVLDGDGMAASDQRFVRNVLTPQMLGRRKDQRRVQISDREARASFSRQTAVLAAEIAQRGYHVVGDLNDLEVAVDPPLDPAHQQVSDAELAEVAMSSTRQLVRLARTERAKAAKHGDKVRRLKARNKHLRKRLADLVGSTGGSGRGPARRLAGRARRVVRRGP